MRQIKFTMANFKIHRNRTIQSLGTEKNIRKKKR
jgi:hypothetical protein